MNWKEHYQSRHISTDEAAALVQPGMRVHFPLAAGLVMQRVLGTRAHDIGGMIDLRLSSPLVDPGWFANDWSAIFRIEFELFIGNLGRPTHDAKRAAYLPNLLSSNFKALDERPNEAKPIDITFVTVTPPNAHGYVSFGPHQWNKRMYVRRARMAVAEVDTTLTRTHGDVYMHVSEFAYFVDVTPPPPDLGAVERELAKMDADKREGVSRVMAEVGVERVAPIIHYLARMSVQDLRVLMGVADPPEEYRHHRRLPERGPRRWRDYPNWRR